MSPAPPLLCAPVGDAVKTLACCSGLCPYRDVASAEPHAASDCASSSSLVLWLPLHSHGPHVGLIESAFGLPEAHYAGSSAGLSVTGHVNARPAQHSSRGVCVYVGFQIRASKGCVHRVVESNPNQASKTPPCCPNVHADAWGGVSVRGLRACGGCHGHVPWWSWSPCDVGQCVQQLHRPRSLLSGRPPRERSLGLLQTSFTTQPRRRHDDSACSAAARRGVTAPDLQHLNYGT